MITTLHIRPRIVQEPLQITDELYFVLIDAPYPDDGVSASCEETVERGIQLQSVHTVTIVLLHLISDHVWDLEEQLFSVNNFHAGLDAQTNH